MITLLRNARFKAMHEKLVKCKMEDLKASDLIKIFFERKNSKKAKKHAKFPLSQIELRSYIVAIVSINLLHSRLEMGKGIEESSTSPEVRRLLSRPLANVLQVAALVTIGQFNPKEIRLIMNNLKGKSYQKSGHNWSVNNSESPLQTIIEEGLAKTLALFAGAIVSGSFIHPAWQCYLEMEEGEMFELVSYYLLFEEGALLFTTRMIELDYFSSGQVKILHTQQVKVARLFPALARRSGVRV